MEMTEEKVSILEERSIKFVQCDEQMKREKCKMVNEHQAEETGNILHQDTSIVQLLKAKIK